MAGYPINMGWIIATEMRDKALNERSGFPFPFLIGKLCRQTDIPPNRLIDRWRDAFRLIQVSKIKDVANHLFGVKSAVVGTLVVVPHVPLEIPQAGRGQEQGESSQPSTEAPPTTNFCRTCYRTLVDHIVIWMPQLIETKELAAKKEINDELRKELAVLKDRMDGLENLVQDQCQAASSVDTEEFKLQLTEMRTQVAKLAEKPVQVPSLIMPDSLMQMITQAPSTQSIDDLWGEFPTSKFGKKKHRAEESHEEILDDLAREAKRQEKRARKASNKETREQQ
ncbi:hypothetical protein KY290_027250 [Solanum tuberosum]|uniref:Integrase core domain containing protein n=1 Tax=Solanum tuberosum TaxID=4113 RepID=A0ABQ7UFP8_SOLTU|nr:hypothetical protein KY290_027250 [Solanum tuberosum]